MQCSKQRDYVMTLAGHPATDGPQRRPKAHKAPGGRAPYGTEVQDDERHSDMPLFQLFLRIALAGRDPQKRKAPGKGYHPGA